MSARRRIVGPGSLPSMTATTPVCAMPVLHVEPEGPQVFGDLGGRAELAVGKLRMAVEVAAPLDDPRIRGTPRPRRARRR